MQESGNVTGLLVRWRAGSREALDALMPLVYPRLRGIAGGLTRRERRESTLQATGLVSELYMRLLEQRQVSWIDREHFYSFAAHMMRLILLDHARARQAGKRGGDAERVPLDPELPWVSTGADDILALDQALTELAAIDAQKVTLVELRYLLGCTALEVAELRGVSKATVDRELRYARAWLGRRLRGDALAEGG